MTTIKNENALKFYGKITDLTRALQEGNQRELLKNIILTEGSECCEVELYGVRCLISDKLRLEFNSLCGMEFKYYYNINKK